MNKDIQQTIKLLDAAILSAQVSGDEQRASYLIGIAIMSGLFILFILSVVATYIFDYSITNVYNLLPIHRLT